MLKRRYGCEIFCHYEISYSKTVAITQNMKNNDFNYFRIFNK